MSAPSFIRIIAEHMCSYYGPPNGSAVSYCWCGWSGVDYPAHVVSKLTDAGYSIIQLPELDDLDCVSAAPGSGKVRCYLGDPRMDVDDARSLAGLLLAAADVAERKSS